MLSQHNVQYLPLMYANTHMSNPSNANKIVPNMQSSKLSPAAIVGAGTIIQLYMKMKDIFLLRKNI